VKRQRRGREWNQNTTGKQRILLFMAKVWHIITLLTGQENLMADGNFSITTTHVPACQLATVPVGGLRRDGPFVVSCACAQHAAYVCSRAALHG